MGICLHGLTGTPRQADAAVRCGSGRCPVPRSYWRPGLEAQGGVAAANVMPGPRRFPAADFSICLSMNRFLIMTAVFSRLLPGPALGSTLQVADLTNTIRNLPGPWTLAAFRRTGEPLPRQPSPRYVTTLHHVENRKLPAATAPSGHEPNGPRRHARQGSDRLSPYRGGRPRPEAPVACKSGRLPVSRLDMARTP